MQVSAMRIQPTNTLVVLVCATSIIGISAVTRVGYALHFRPLYQCMPGEAAMSLNSAVSFILTGFALTVIGSSDRLWSTDATTDA